MSGKLQRGVPKTAALSVLALGLLFAREVRAEKTTQVAVDLEYAASIDEDEVGSGAGVSLRLGYRLELPRISLVPEIGASFQAFSGDRDAKLYTGFAGVRLGLGGVVEPSIFVHAGLGKLAGREPDTGPTFDVGLALTLTRLPHLDVGVHAAYANMFLDGGENLDCLHTGLHAGIGF